MIVNGVSTKAIALALKATAPSPGKTDWNVKTCPAKDRNPQLMLNPLMFSSDYFYITWIAPGNPHYVTEVFPDDSSVFIFHHVEGDSVKDAMGLSFYYVEDRQDYEIALWMPGKKPDIREISFETSPLYYRETLSTLDEFTGIMKQHLGKDAKREPDNSLTVANGLLRKYCL